MDETYVERCKTELYAAEKIFEQAQRERFQARKVLAEKEEAFTTAWLKVDTLKNMLISALEPSKKVKK